MPSPGNGPQCLKATSAWRGAEDALCHDIDTGRNNSAGLEFE